jgi:hypothetical protein
VCLLFAVSGPLTFHSDEWTVIAHPPVTLADWFSPHNEHWSTGLFVVYQALHAAVGLRSYAPYLAVLWTLHVAAALGVYRLVGGLTSRWVALGAAIVMLFLGTAYQDLLWAFQTGFVGSTAAGIWALVAIESGGRRSGPSSGLLLTISVATSGIGLPFLATALVLVACRADRGRRLRWLGVPVGAYLSWFLLIGRSAVAVNNDVFSPAAIAMAPVFAMVGSAQAIAAASGLSGPAAALVGALGFVALIVSWAHSLIDRIGWHLPRVPLWLSPARVPEMTAAVAGLVVLYSLVGLTRSQFGLSSATQSRYLYPAVAFVLLAIAAFVDQRLEGARAGRRVVALAGAVALLAVSLGSNLVALRDGQRVFEAYATDVRALTSVALRYADAPSVDPGRELFALPPAPVLAALLRAEGWPASGSDAELAALPPEAVDIAIREIVADAVRVTVEAGAPSPSMAPAPIVVATRGSDVRAAEGCVAVESAAGGSIELRMQDGAALALTTTASGRATVSLGRFAPPPMPGSIAIDPPEGGFVALHLPDLHVPDLGESGAWRLGVAFESASEWRICSTS